MSAFQDLINGSTPVLIDFFADWCSPCHSMNPVIKEIKSNYGEKLKVIKIDIDKNINVAEKFQVKGVPTFIVYKKGEIVWRQSGVIEKSKFISKIDSII
ncbi:MAG: thioredoxin [Crocinitomicaceae bacterium]|nr:thioredoxin [Crocinitomicaceae bacterium]